jgi:hypothetical protein
VTQGKLIFVYDSKTIFLRLLLSVKDQVTLKLTALGD